MPYLLRPRLILGRVEPLRFGRVVRDVPLTALPVLLVSALGRVRWLGGGHGEA